MGRKSKQKNTKTRFAEISQSDLERCMCVDQKILKRHLGRLRPDDELEIQRFRQQLARAVTRQQVREASCPEVLFTGELPIHEKLDEIAIALREHQVIVICGETGSGKTTQIAKLCLSAGRGRWGYIGHTQPRRIAARAVAGRISEEMNTPLGSAVGYKVRHNDNTSPDTYIKVMTDGILLAELQQDRWLERYDTLIIDEAHERSLNIDFLLGYLKQLLPKRPGLKLIITSATIDVKRFSEFFNGAPVIEVSGRTFPVEVLYRPMEGSASENVDIDMVHAHLLEVVRELSQYDRGDILIFLEGEREIHEASRFLRQQQLPDTDILPLYSRLSSARQSAIFRPHKRRHIILATNVAETSLTIPGIRYVIDRGHARISRYSRRNKVQQLPVEKISRASAEQRKGRCGRVAEGICVRLYTEEDYRTRTEFTDPEILRTNLGSVILQMKSLKLGDIREFPFLDPPDSRYINDGLRLLTEIRALDKQGYLTRTGRQVARLPVDPRLGVILVTAGDFKCVNEILTIVSALSTQDPRERPPDYQEKADESHQQFAHEHSDFLSLFNLWQLYHQQARKLSQNRLRKFCRENFISYVKMREWIEIRKQLSRQLREMDIMENRQPADYKAVHQALIHGLLGNVAMKTDTKEYTAARGITIHIFPGSNQFACLPKWIIAAELVETSRLYARTVARIDPRWLIRPASHISRSEYYEPYWDRKTQQVMVFERITLYGLVIASGQKVNYANINPRECRDIFIRDALFGEQLDFNVPFLSRNRSVVEDIRLLERKARRQDIYNEQGLYDFYSANIPEHICDGHTFRKWYQSASKEDRDLLCVESDTIMYPQRKRIAPGSYPDNVIIHGNRLNMKYRFEPSASDDGATLDVPVFLLNQIRQETLDKLVPGTLYDKILFLLKSLPKNIRRQLVPVPDTAAECARGIDIDDKGLSTSLRNYLTRIKGIRIPENVWFETELPDHLKVNIRVIDSENNILAQGRDIERLQTHLGSHIDKELRSVSAAGIECDGLVDWDFDDLPVICTIEINKMPVKMFPALVDMKESVSIRLFDTREKAEQAMQSGLIRLFRIACRKEFKYLEKNLPHSDEMDVYYTTFGQMDDLKEELFDLVIKEVFLSHNDPIRTKQMFNAFLTQGRTRLVSVANDVCKLVYTILGKFEMTTSLLNGDEYPGTQESVEEINDHLSSLVYRGFLSDISLPELRRYPRYIDAILRRLEKIIYSPERDRKLSQKIGPFWDFYKDQLESGVWTDSFDKPLKEFRYMLEEYRVSLFAQELGTSMKISAKKLQKHMEMMKSGSKFIYDEHRIQ